MSRFTVEQYGGTKEIRKFEHSVCVPYKVSQSTTGVQTVNGVKVIPAGTILPKNDATAIGIVLNDTVVEYGECACALLIHGFIDGNKLPTQPTNLAVGALKQIHFFDVTPT